MLKIKETEHPYYCEKYTTNNYQEYDNWDNFKKNFCIKTIDNDLNYLVRYDLKSCDNNLYKLELFYIQQRKGRFVPVIISNITENNFKEIDDYLKNCWSYMQIMWKEYSE